MRTQEVSLNVNNFTLVSNKVKQLLCCNHYRSCLSAAQKVQLIIISCLEFEELSIIWLLKNREILNFSLGKCFSPCVAKFFQNLNHYKIYHYILLVIFYISISYLNRSKRTSLISFLYQRSLGLLKPLFSGFAKIWIYLFY